MLINWYPGHMAKTRRMMEEDIRLVDLILELVDARIPASSRNPDIDRLGKGKARIVLLNKADLADASCSRQWSAYFAAGGILTLEIDSRTGAGVRAVQKLAREACREKLERDRRRGIVNRPIRAMVAGIPNVGKSTFINAFAGKACAKTGNRPGVTRGKQWIRRGGELELLDTPGLLWPKFEDQSVGRRLAFVGSINDEILMADALACELIKELQVRYPDALAARYGIGADGDAQAVLKEIAERRKCFGRGETLDLERAAALLLDDFRSGRLGRITLEMPPEEEKQ